MSYKYLFLLVISIFHTQNIAAETRIEHQCKDAIMDVTRVMMSTGNIALINQTVIKSTNIIKVREYLTVKWIPMVKDDESFTPNTLALEADKYTQHCVEFSSR
ncbi:MAG: hypothetical protein ABGY11_15780 [Candidatus Thioglobus sp.]|jgi:hypothetical protein